MFQTEVTEYENYRKGERISLWSKESMFNAYEIYLCISIYRYMEVMQYENSWKGERISISSKDSIFNTYMTEYIWIEPVDARSSLFYMASTPGANMTLSPIWNFPWVIYMDAQAQGLQAYGTFPGHIQGAKLQVQSQNTNQCSYSVLPLQVED